MLRTTDYLLPGGKGRAYDFSGGGGGGGLATSLTEYKRRAIEN